VPCPSYAAPAPPRLLLRFVFAASKRLPLWDTALGCAIGATSASEQQRRRGGQEQRARPATAAGGRAAGAARIGFSVVVAIGEARASVASRTAGAIACGGHAAGTARSGPVAISEVDARIWGGATDSVAEVVRCQALAADALTTVGALHV
jgi:hypothetical protein